MAENSRSVSAVTRRKLLAGTAVAVIGQSVQAADVGDTHIGDDEQTGRPACRGRGEEHRTVAKILFSGGNVRTAPSSSGYSMTRYGRSMSSPH